MQDDGDKGTTEQDAEEKARVEAEARRQKILEEAGNRMDRVTGIVSSNTSSEEATPGNDNPETPAPISSKSDRLAAMRRRRFKKKADTKPEDSSTGVSDANTTATQKESATSSSPQDTTVGDAGKIQKVEPSAASIQGTTDSINPEKDNQEDDGAPKKKYMGVAKMRRKMIKERQAKEEAEAKATLSVAESENDALSAKFAAKKLRKVSVVPILMHIVTVVLLFLAGLDIGLQQSRIQYSKPDVMIHRELAPVHRLEAVGSGNIAQIFSFKAPAKNVMEDAHVDYDVDEAVENEFEEDIPNMEESETDNIDPLFQVDLDKYTQGPGIFMMAGRFAVACHRVNLSIFYYFPMRLFERFKATLLALSLSPPMIFLLALAIRQAIGKVILGADLPEIGEDEKQRQDVIGTVKNFAKSFVVKTFPTAVNLYDAWVHLRADMYVVLCGLFVGIAWCHHFEYASNSVYEQTDKQNTATVEEIDSTTTEPLSDEL